VGWGLLPGEKEGDGWVGGLEEEEARVGLLVAAA
jgi:hypothetical protein